MDWHQTASSEGFAGKSLFLSAVHIPIPRPGMNFASSRLNRVLRGEMTGIDAHPTEMTASAEPLTALAPWVQIGLRATVVAFERDRFCGPKSTITEGRVPCEKRSAFDNMKFDGMKCLFEAAAISMINLSTKWCPLRDSNPCFCRERAAS